MSYYPSPQRAECYAVIGSMTSAMKAQRLLSKHALRTNVKKTVPHQNGSGCIYGIEFDCALSERVKSILSFSDIEVKEYLR